MIEHDRDDGGLLAIGWNEPQRDAPEGRHGQADAHAHSTHRPPQHHMFAMKFHLTHLPVRSRILRRIADGKREGIEPQRADRPGRWDPAGLHLTPRNNSPRAVVARYGRDNATELSESA